MPVASSAHRRAISALAALASAAGCGGPDAPCGPREGRVERVIDGDTIVLSGDRTIRYLLIDAPETTGGHTDCFGANAARLNADLVLGKTVQLDYDPAACEDRFGRTLAYVTVDGQDLSRLMIERGYACVLHIPPAGDAHVAELEALELAARAARRGVWGACDPVPCD